MSDTITIPKADLTRLEERVRKLAADKSSLELIVRLMNRVTGTSGLDHTAVALLRAIGDVIGGVDHRLYYRLDDELWYVDALGSRKRLDAIDDELVQEVFASRESLEREHDVRDTRMQDSPFTKAYTWVVPLTVGLELIAVIKVESLHVAMRELSAPLPTFFSHAALMLKSEMLGQSRLQRAYADLKREVEVRRQAEQELRNANAFLEQRLAERTAELRQVYDRSWQEQPVPTIATGTTGDATRSLSTILAEEEQVDAALRRATDEIRDLYDRAPCGYHSVDKDGVFVRMNETELSWLGYTRDEVIGRLRFSDLLTPASREDFEREFPLFKERGWARDLHFEFLRKDGTVLPVVLNATSIQDAEGRFLSSRSVVLDVTERRRAELQLQRLNRELTAISNCNEALMRATDEKMLLADICQIVSEEAGYRMAWVGYAEHDAAKTIRPIAWAGTDQRCLPATGLSWADNAVAAGPTGAAIRDGTTVVFQDLTTDPLSQSWRQLAIEHGYRSSVALPLKDETGACFGALSICAVEQNAFPPAEVRLLEELAANLAFGIVALRTREKRLRAESELSEREKKYRTLIENLQAAVVVHGADTRIVICNPVAQSLLGRTEKELLGRKSIDPAWRFLREDGTEMPVAEYPVNQVAASRRPLRNLVAGIQRPGTPGEVWMLANADPVFDREGGIVETIVTFIEITELKRTEESLRSSESRYRMAQALGRVGNWEYNLQTGHFFGSDEARRLYGFDPARDDFSTDEVENCIPERDRVHQALVDLLNDGKPYNLEFEIRPRDGSRPRIIASIADLIRDAHGKPLKVVGVIQDITERRQAEAKIRHLAAIVESTDDAVIGKTLDERIVSWNAAAERMYGYASEEITGQPVSRLVPPDRIGELETIMARLRAGDRIQHLETIRLRKDGRQFDVALTISPVRDADGHVVGASTIARDISERKRAQEALRESVESLRSLTESMPQLVWMCRPDGRNTFFNQRWVEYTGLSLDESYGDGWNKPFHPDDRQRAWEAWQNAVQSGGRYDLECRLRRADGVYQWFLIRGVPLRDSAGEITKWFGTCTNVDELKQAQEEIRRLNAELETRVRERTAELEAANRELEAFSYSVSHDLRAPLRSIDGFSRILQQDFGDKLGDDGQESLRTIRSATQRMAVLIDAMLKLARVSRAELRRASIDLSSLVGAIIGELRDAHPERSVAVSIAPRLTARADPALIRAMLENLLENAWKFTNRQPNATIEFGCIDAETGRTFFVRDNGAGFDPEYAPKLFKPFQRLHTTEDFPGTGIGLASVQRIVQRHGGRIWAEGRLGQGATFFFTLPSEAGN